MNFMRKKSFTVFVFLLAFSLLLSACGKSNTKEESKEEKEMIPVEHAMGKTEVPANPKRVVILTNEGTEALLELGVKPVGAVKSWTGSMVSTY